MISILCWGRSYHWMLLLGVRLGSSLTLLNTRLGVPRVASTCCFFRAANGSWLSVSLKHTTFNNLHSQGHVHVTENVVYAAHLVQVSICHDHFAPIPSLGQATRSSTILGVNGLCVFLWFAAIKKTACGRGQRNLAPNNPGMFFRNIMFSFSASAAIFFGEFSLSFVAQCHN